MTGILVSSFLILAVTASWLAAAAFVRLRTPLDRLHCSAFVNIVSGIALTGASLASDGLAARPLKVFLIFLINLIGGAAVAHALGRTLMRRGEKP